MHERLKSQLSALKDLVSPGIQLRAIDRGQSAVVFAITKNSSQKDQVDRAYEFIVDNIGTATRFVVLPIEKAGMKPSLKQFLEQTPLVSST